FFSGRPSQAALLDLVQPAARPVVAFVERLNVAAPGFAPPLVLAPSTRWVEVGALVGLARSLPASGLNEQAPTEVTGFLRKVAGAVPIAAAAVKSVGDRRAGADVNQLRLVVAGHLRSVALVSACHRGL